MLDIFWGGYLFHPAALDYSDDTCQNGCAYCFANINKAFREGNLKGAINHLYKKQPLTYTDMLLSDGYPILISNRSDGFSKNNIRKTQALFLHLAEMKNSIFIQTKCGEGMEDTIAMLGDRRDVIIYITITTINDDIAKIVEPNAPLPSARLQIANRLHAAGYLVLIAINPCNESWMPIGDMEALTQQLKSSGIRHICIEMLDLKHKRLASMSADRKGRLCGALDTLGQRNRDYVRESTQYLLQQGFVVAKKGMPFKTEFFKDMAAKLGPTMPVLQDFVNHCFDTYGTAGAIIGFTEFEKIMLRPGVLCRNIRQNTLRGYLLRSGLETWKTNQQIHSHRELLHVVWNDNRHHMGIRNHCLYRTIGRNGVPALDSAGDVQLYFNGSPHFGGKKEVIDL